jgi:hypothetical protein
MRMETSQQAFSPQGDASTCGLNVVTIGRLMGEGAALQLPIAANCASSRVTIAAPANEYTRHFVDHCFVIFIYKIRKQITYFYRCGGMEFAC